MPQLATAPRPALRFVTPAKAALFRVPYFPQGIPAGFPSPADDHLQKALDLHEHLIKHPAATFFAHVEGDSMIDANLHGGDLLIIDRAERLMPENKAFPVIEVTEGMDFEIWGVLSHIIHKAT